MTPRAKTAEEVREEFLDHIHVLVRYWSKTDCKTCEEKLSGLAFSILNIFDGGSADLPAMDIVLSPHPDDTRYFIDEDMNWYEPGMVINDCQLHEGWCVGKRES